jgi:mRNA interferase MazF
VAAVTSTIKIYPVTVPLKKGEGGLPRASRVNLAQLLTIDRARLQDRVGTLSAERMGLVDAAIRVSLDVG